MNIPLTCKALGTDLRDLVSEFWAAYPESNVHFYIETERFCRFLEAKLAEGRTFAPDVPRILAMERAIITAALGRKLYRGPPERGVSARFLQFHPRSTSASGRARVTSWRRRQTGIVIVWCVSDPNRRRGEVVPDLDSKTITIDEIWEDDFEDAGQ